MPSKKRKGRNDEVASAILAPSINEVIEG